ncbi:hypothetical protein F4780DRAFT_760581 [Xylariomycetidae sp. FL0641]|nr:hypothetical protein F4780DRAFT_760581 [Xylariomycetidae sp. FL0641]
MPKVVIDPDGDLCLKVGTSPAKSFIVCSKALSRSSAFFKKLLYGGFAESKSKKRKLGSESRKEAQGSEKGEWAVELPEDNPDAMERLLKILHCQFDAIPFDYMPEAELYELTVLTDKYDLTRILRPWARAWCRAVNERAVTAGFAPNAGRTTNQAQQEGQRIWILWELGDTAALEKMTKDILLKFRVPPDGESTQTPGVLEPPSYVENIARLRLAVLEVLLSLIRDFVQGLAAKKQHSLCRYNHTDCEVLMLGTIIRSLCAMGLWPIPEASNYTGCVSELATSLKSVACDGSSGKYNHDKCSGSGFIKSQVDSALNGIRSSLTDGHRRHLEAQAIKSGLKEKQEVGS